MKAIDRPLTQDERTVLATLSDVEAMRTNLLRRCTGLQHEALYRALVGLEGQGLARVVTPDRSRHSLRLWQSML